MSLSNFTNTQNCYVRFWPWSKHCSGTSGRSFTDSDWENWIWRKWWIRCGCYWSLEWRPKVRYDFLYFLNSAKLHFSFVKHTLVFLHHPGKWEVQLKLLFVKDVESMLIKHIKTIPILMSWSFMIVVSTLLNSLPTLLFILYVVLG